MPKLITRCISEDYQTVTDNHDDSDRGEIDISALKDALVYGSYIMPHSSDPNSPHRPAMGVVLAGKTRPTFFYASDYQGGYSLEPADTGEFDSDDIVNMVVGKMTMQEVRDKKAASDKSMSRTIKFVLGSILLVILYYIAAPLFGW